MIITGFFAVLAMAIGASLWATALLADREDDAADRPSPAADIYCPAAVSALGSVMPHIFSRL